MLCDVEEANVRHAQRDLRNVVDEIGRVAGDVEERGGHQHARDLARLLLFVNSRRSVSLLNNSLVFSGRHCGNTIQLSNMSSAIVVKTALILATKSLNFIIL